MPTAGRYVGVITIIEKVPVLPGSAALPEALPKDLLTSRASGQVVGSVHGNRIRITAKPGFTLLGYLDEPNYATISLDTIYANPGGQFLGRVASARKESGQVSFNPSRIRLTFETTAPHLDFVNGDQPVNGSVKIRVDLVRVEN